MPQFAVVDSEQRIDRFLRLAGLLPLHVRVEQDIARVELRHLGASVWLEARYQAESTDESIAADIIDQAENQGIRRDLGS